MTITHEILVRHGDCDPLGHLRTSAYLTYLHESDLAAMEAASLLPVSEAQVWSAKQIVIEFLQPLLPGERVQVSVGFHGVHGDLSLRSYEIRRSGEVQPAARAAAAWRLVDKSSLEPVQIPGDVFDDLSAGSDAPLPVDLEMPALSPPAPEPLTVQHQVSWGDISVDYQLSYRAWVDLMIECGLRSGVRYGWTMQRSQEMDMTFVARKLWLSLDEPARYGEEVSITTWLAEPRRSTIYRQYFARRLPDEAVIARASVLWVYLDLTSGRPARMPEEFMDNFRQHVA